METGNSKPQRLLTFLPDLPLDLELCEWLVCLTQLCSNQSFMDSPQVKITLGRRSQVTSWFSNAYRLCESSKVDNYSEISEEQMQVFQKTNWEKMSTTWDVMCQKSSSWLFQLIPSFSPTWLVTPQNVMGSPCCWHRVPLCYVCCTMSWRFHYFVQVKCVSIHFRVSNIFQWGHPVLQIRNPQTMHMYVWIKTGDDGEENKNSDSKITISDFPF